MTTRAPSHGEGTMLALQTIQTVALGLLAAFVALDAFAYVCLRLRPR